MTFSAKRGKKPAKVCIAHLMRGRHSVRRLHGESWMISFQIEIKDIPHKIPPYATNNSQYVTRWTRRSCSRQDKNNKHGELFVSWTLARARWGELIDAIVSIFDVEAGSSRAESRVSASCIRTCTVFALRRLLWLLFAVVVVPNSLTLIYRATLLPLEMFKIKPAFIAAQFHVINVLANEVCDFVVNNSGLGEGAREP